MVLAIDKSAKLYVANSGFGFAPSIIVYCAAVLMAMSDQTIIAGRSTGLLQTTGVAVDAHGNIYAANHFNSGSVTVYSPGSNGDIVPMFTLTTVPTPWGLALDAADNLYVTESGGVAGGAEIAAFAPGSNGKQVPSRAFPH